MRFHVSIETWKRMKGAHGGKNEPGPWRVMRRALRSLSAPGPDNPRGAFSVYSDSIVG